MLYFNVALADYYKLPEGVTVNINGIPRKLFLVTHSPRSLIRWEEDGIQQEREIYDVTLGTCGGTGVAISAVEKGQQPPVKIVSTF